MQWGSGAHMASLPPPEFSPAGGGHSPCLFTGCRAGVSQLLAASLTLLPGPFPSNGDSLLTPDLLLPLFWVFLALFSFCFCDTGAHVSQTGLKLTMQLRMP